MQPEGATSGVGRQYGKGVVRAARWQPAVVQKGRLQGLAEVAVLEEAAAEKSMEPAAIAKQQQNQRNQ